MRILSVVVVFLLASGCPRGRVVGASDGGPRADDTECTSDSDCTSGYCPPVSGERRVCRPGCSVSGTCPDGQSCVSVDGERVCLYLVDNRGLGEACQGSRQCASGVCASLPAEDGGVCVGTCPADEMCSNDLVCAVDVQLGAVPYCTPRTDRRVRGADCTNGRECLDGRCVPWGARLQCAPSCLGCSEADAGQTCLQDPLRGEACVTLITGLQPCGANTECAYDSCLRSHDGGAAVCVDPCGPDNACPSGGACVETAKGPRCIPLRDDRPAGTACVTAQECLSGRCARFAATGFDAGFVCADPCTGGMCTTPLVCWGYQPDAGRRGVCGPDPF